MVLINGWGPGLSKSKLKTPHRQINSIKKKLDFHFIENKVPLKNVYHTDFLFFWGISYKIQEISPGAIQKSNGKSHVS